MNKMKKSFFFFNKGFYFVLGLIYILEGLILVFSLGTIKTQLSTNALGWYILKTFDFVEYNV